MILTSVQRLYSGRIVGSMCQSLPSTSAEASALFYEKGRTQDLLPSTSRLPPTKRSIQRYVPQGQNLVHRLLPECMHEQMKFLTSGMPTSGKTVCIYLLFRRSASTKRHLFIYPHSVTLTFPLFLRLLETIAGALQRTCTDDPEAGLLSEGGLDSLPSLRG